MASRSLNSKDTKGGRRFPSAATQKAVAVILGNPVMISAYQAEIPGNGKPVPDKLANVDFMLKDSKRFADSGGWGYAVSDYDTASDTFKPGTSVSTPPQGNDANCGYACHTLVKKRDYVFTYYGKR